MKYFLLEINPITFYPILCTLLFFVLLAVVFVILEKINPKKEKSFKIIIGIIASLAILGLIVYLSIYYKREIENTDLGINSKLLWISGAIIVALFVLFYLFCGKKENHATKTKTIAFGAVFIGLAYGLSYVKLFFLPQGGSITLLSLLPLLLFSYIFGIRKGIIIGLIYGILQAMTDLWIIHPMQFFLDYPLAFASIGLGGILSDLKIFDKYPWLQIMLGGILAGFMRYGCHVLSGIFAFASYVGEGYSLVGWSFAYNSFALVDIALSIIAGVLLFLNKSFVNEVKKINVTQKNSTTEQ